MVRIVLFCVPIQPGLKRGQEEDTAKEMIDWLIKNGKLTVKEFRMKTAIMMAVAGTIKANHHLDEREAKALLKRLPQCENPLIVRMGVR